MTNRLTSPRVIKEMLNCHQLAPRKSLGQNFLIDANIQQKIIQVADISQADFVLEIGPGMGALTESLVELAGKVVAVEYDKGLAALLAEIFGNKSNFTLLNQDFLEINLPTLLDVYAKEAYPYKVVANLPYYITTPVIFKLIETEIAWESMVFLVQKEVAERICARPGNKNYGALTVMLGFFGRVEKVFQVPRTVFYPTPQVDSMVIKIIKHSVQDRTIYPYLRKVVQAAFGQRRKTILNALTPLESYFGGKKDLIELLTRFEIDPSQRGETLAIDRFLKLAEELRTVISD